MSFLEIALIGDTETGKTSLLKTFTGSVFKEYELVTIGIIFYIKTIKSSDNLEYKLKIFDTAGCEQYRSMSLHILIKCKGAILVYSIDDKSSFENIKNIWINDINIYNLKIPIVLVGNKKDLEIERIISEEEGRKIAEENNFSFFETSAKTGENINQIFEKLVEIIPNDIKEKYANNNIKNNNKKNNYNNKKNNDKIDKEGKCIII